MIIVYAMLKTSSNDRTPWIPVIDWQLCSDLGKTYLNLISKSSRSFLEYNEELNKYNNQTPGCNCGQINIECKSTYKSAGGRTCSEKGPQCHSIQPLVLLLCRTSFDSCLFGEELGFFFINFCLPTEQIGILGFDAFALHYELVAKNHA